MYKVDTRTGAITFPDGFVLKPPYEHERYLTEYASWVQAGNSPEEVSITPLEGTINIKVTPYQARVAMIRNNVYHSKVLPLMETHYVPEEVKIKFEYATEFERNDPTILQMAELLEWDGAFLDLLFTEAELVT